MQWKFPSVYINQSTKITDWEKGTIIPLLQKSLGNRTCIYNSACRPWRSGGAPRRLSTPPGAHTRHTRPTPKRQHKPHSCRPSLPSPIWSNGWGWVISLWRRREKKREIRVSIGEAEARERESDRAGGGKEGGSIVQGFFASLFLYLTWERNYWSIATEIILFTIDDVALSTTLFLTRLMIIIFCRRW
jgi:hypothetical protein